MFTSLWAWIVGLFAKENVGILFTILFKVGKSIVASKIADKKLQKEAWEAAKELALRDDLSNEEKAKMFNERLKEFSKTSGISIGESVLNCLRELAVNALKAQSGK